MRKLHRLLWAGLVATAVAACTDQLTVVNNNSPDQERALARPTDVENLIVASAATAHGAVYTTSVMPALHALGMENYSNLANFGMGTRSQIPRPPIANGRNNPTAGENYSPFQLLHRAARAAGLGLGRVNAPEFTFFPNSTTQEARARAFAHFVMGIALGQLAMVYDSGVAVNENDDPSPTAAPIPLVSADSLAKYALAKLDSAIAIAATMGTQTIPTSWLRSSAALTIAQFQAYARGWKARIRAYTVRRPTDAAAVDWASVLSDANSFISTYSTAGGFVQQLDPAAGWSSGWTSVMYQSNSVNWHQLWGFMMGMADTSGGYDVWLSTSVALRVPFVVATRDLRLPRGTTRSAQQAASGTYIENRGTGNDWFGEPLGNSQYRHIRWLALRNASLIGPFNTMPVQEIRMLAAEALKWEMRMEVAYCYWGGWYFNGRRWGDLPEGTPLQYPVPYQEMDTRRQAFYDLGGVGLTDGAPRGNYGL